MNRAMKIFYTYMHDYPECKMHGWWNLAHYGTLCITTEIKIINI